MPLVKKDHYERISDLVEIKNSIHLNIRCTSKIVPIIVPGRRAHLLRQAFWGHRRDGNREARRCKDIFRRRCQVVSASALIFGEAREPDLEQACSTGGPLLHGQTAPDRQSLLWQGESRQLTIASVTADATTLVLSIGFPLSNLMAINGKHVIRLDRV